MQGLHKIRPHDQRNTRFCTLFAICHAFEVTHKVRATPWGFVMKAWIKIWGRVFDRALGVMEAANALEGRRIQCRGLGGGAKNIRFAGLERMLFSHGLIRQLIKTKPVIIVLKYSHVVVIVGYFKDAYNREYYEVINSQVRGGYQLMATSNFNENNFFYFMK